MMKTASGQVPPRKETKMKKDVAKNKHSSKTKCVAGEDCAPLTGYPLVMDYDPNLTNSGRMATQTVRLTFGTWKYRTERTLTVGGNCTGLDVIKAAVGRAYEALEYHTYKGKDYSRITLADADGNELECEDEDWKGEGWLADMLIGAEITDIVPDEENDNILS